MKIVLDTNILVSALITKGTPPDLLYQAWSVGDFGLVPSDRQFDELTRVLAYEKLQRYIKPQAASVLLANMQEMAEMVTGLRKVDYSPDPDDNWIIATALQGGADYIVSGDKRDMISITSVEDIKIMTANDAIDILLP
ncbi:MAG: putative toxin-antitoxin system toxin component, PIN family [Gammaproteobacteria bacterium]|nr:putative toxin-antitoxin system toxin component, PIN family [Gammaproteobacteria bacterium]